ncbi:MAG: hypothetical protein MOGMAGMI_00086 [Candidatus Omnitrophica bacterium]|nr:hypothetical protein [Candidatus Omnitrophota bacterium]
MRVLIAGGTTGTHVGASWLRSAVELGHEARLLDAAEAYRGPAPLRALAWRMGRRPLGLARYSKSVSDTVKEWRPDLFLSAGVSPVTERTLRQMDPAVRKAVYLTDDPWNASHRAAWQLKAITAYDQVYTTKTALEPDLKRLGCRQVSYLPFAYDPEHFHPAESVDPVERARYASEVLFYGGADNDRVLLIKSLINQSVPMTLYGGYWERDPLTRAHWRGQVGPQVLRQAIAGAAINLCLVRRSNRDGHSMRSFEIPAVGGCLIAEDTAEHRALYGEDGRCVRYFKGITDAAALIRRLLDAPEERRRLAEAAHRLIRSGGHTYTDRLRAILEAGRIS